jgi:hypothetical protein
MPTRQNKENLLLLLTKEINKNLKLENEKHNLETQLSKEKKANKL